MEAQQLSVAVPAGLEGEANKVLSVALAYKIDSVEMYALAADELKVIKGKAAAWEAKRKEIVDPLNKAVKGVNDFFRQPIALLAQAEKSLKDGMLAYDAEQDRLQRERESELQRQRDQEAAEARRIAEEAQRAAEQADTPEEKAQAQAKIEEAQARVEEVVTMPTPIVAKSSPQVSGVSRRSNWRGEVVDKMALIKAVAEGKAPAELLDVNQTKLNQMAKALQSALAYPGCKAVEDKILASSKA